MTFRNMKLRHIVSLFTALFLLQACDYSFGDSSYFKRKPGVAPVSNTMYKTECGSCHFAYQPGLLPEQSWHKIMNGLADHFGDNAELDSASQQQILGYLTANSADKSDFRRSKKIMRSLRNKPAPLRISEIRYIKGRHHEIPKRMITGNEKVGSLSHCDACHQKINQGSFREHEVRIPGYGHWDD